MPERPMRGGKGRLGMRENKGDKKNKRKDQGGKWTNQLGEKGGKILTLGKT